MPVPSFLSRTLPLALLGTVLAPMAHASVVSTGTFTGDDQVFSYNFTVTSPLTYTFTTTSYAAGGFLPELTLFNSTTGKFINTTDGTLNGNQNGSDAALLTALGAGSYLLDLSVFPNGVSGNGTATDAFQFAGDPTITGEFCSASGSFYNTVTCQQRTAAYALNVTTAPSVPEPSTFLLLLPGAGLAALLAKRQIA